jgi:hypothetical protein
MTASPTVSPTRTVRTPLRWAPTGPRRGIRADTAFPSLSTDSTRAIATPAAEPSSCIRTGISDQAARGAGKIGRSYGCFVVDRAKINDVVRRLEGGGFLYAGR